MTTTQDCSIGLAVESTYKTGVTVTRWYEFLEESLDWTKNTKQGGGLRVGSRVARSGRRVVPTAEGGGDITCELASKGFGLLWQAAMGAGVSTLVSGATYQQLFTLGDQPSSLTVQKGLVEKGGTVDAYTFLGCMVDGFEVNCPNGDIATLKVTLDAGDLATATAYAAPSYPAAPVNLFHFANGTLTTGTLTAPTATTAASSSGTTANIRDFSLSVNHNLTDGYNLGGAGRKSKPTVGERDITGKITVEYDSTTYRDLVLGDTPLCIVLTFTAGALGVGLETFQIVLPEVKFDSELPKANGNDLIVQSMSFTVLDNLTAAQPIWVVARTADIAL